MHRDYGYAFRLFSYVTGLGFSCFHKPPPTRTSYIIRCPFATRLSPLPVANIDSPYLLPACYINYWGGYVCWTWNTYKLLWRFILPALRRYYLTIQYMERLPHTAHTYIYFVIKALLPGLRGQKKIYDCDVLSRAHALHPRPLELTKQKPGIF